MERLLRRAPRTALGKARLCGVLFACVGVLPMLGQVSAEHPPGRRAATIFALVLLLAVYLLTYLRRRTTWLEPLLAGPALVVGCSGLRDPMTVIGVAMGVLVTQSLYGSRRMAVVRTLAATASLPVTIAISPISLGRYIPWLSGAVIGLVPVIGMTAVLMRALYSSLVRQESAAERERVLARTGSHLLGRTDAHEVRMIVREAAATLCAQLPGVGLLVLRRDGDEVVVDGSAGFPVTVRGVHLPATCVDGLDPLDSDRSQRVAHPDELDQLSGRRHWRAVGLATADAERFMLVGGVRAVSSEVFDAFRTLATQWSLADANCGAHTLLAQRANYDQLTGLPNRTLFFQRLAADVDAADGREDTVALLIADLDDFKEVNDGYGHAAGDELLVQVARRLGEIGGEGALPARFGGDEFALLLTGLTDPDEAARMADRLSEQLLEPFQLSQATVSIGVSVGLAGAAPGLTAGDLMRCADIAMYSAKAKGKNRVERFTESGHGEIAKLRLLEEHLLRAVDRDELVLHYQPQIDLASGRCTAVEALVRWQHPTMGLLPPGTFVPMAERSGHIVVLGGHVLRAACRQMAAWASVPDTADLRVAVNVAPRQLVDARFAGTVEAALRDSGLAPDRLMLEITESELIDERTAREQLQRVADLGVRIAIDDFGTGYASLASLRAFPIHQLKIDRSFLATGDGNRADEMLELVASVSRILDLEAVAEGVETEAQAELVRNAGVPMAQGYLFGRPMPAPDLATWLAAHSGAARQRS